MDEDDASLLAAAREGSDLAFNRLVDRHQQAVRTFLRGLVAGPDDADDLAQETFLAAWRNAASYRGVGGVRSWLFAIAWRKAADSRRRWFRRGRRDAAFHQAGLDQHAPPSAKEDIIALHQALGALSLEQKGAVMLCLGLGL